MVSGSTIIVREGHEATNPNAKEIESNVFFIVLLDGMTT
jgi:hypothetical protein